MKIPKEIDMMQELINQIKRQAVMEAMSENSIELKHMFPTKESFIDALNNNSPLLMELLPRLLKLPKELKLRHVDYIPTAKSIKGKKTAEEKREHHITFHVTTSDLQEMEMKKDIDRFYEKICGVRMRFAFKLEKGYDTKEWYDYNN